jgi:uncharacterized protein YprB with RNaseH-like and TPR domain
MNESKILIFDIESSGLKGDFANCFCFGYMYHGEKKAHVLSVFDITAPCPCCHRIDTSRDDRLMRRVHKVMSEADMWVTWYGKGFDWKFLNTRILDAGLPLLPDTPHVDLYYTAKHKLALTSNRLANVQEFLRLPTEKTQLTKRIWRKAQTGHVGSLRYIIDHCEKDVLVLDQAYAKLRPYVKQHPRVGGKDGCRICGGPLISHKLRMTTILGPQRQYQCKACGHYETRSGK